jgi:hypothetical protein
MNPSDEASDLGWRLHLAALPDVAPPERLWQRLQQARPATRPARRAALRWASAAALLLATAGLISQWRPTSAPAPGPLMNVAAPVPVDAGLRQLDDEIALAYARDAGEAELASLWQTRERLLETLQGPAPALLARL